MPLLASVAVTAPAAPVKVVYWRALTGAAGDVQDELVKKFNESQGEVAAEAQFQGAYAEVVQKLPLNPRLRSSRSAPRIASP